MSIEYYALKGAISELPQDRQDKIAELEKQFIELLEQGEEGKIALALVAAKLAALEEKNGKA